MTTMKKLSWATLTALAVALSACGNDDDNNNNAPPAATGDQNSWSQLTFLTDCDRSLASPGTVPLPAPNAPGPNGGNGTGTGTNTATGTASDVSINTGTNTGTSTGTNTGDTADINALNERMLSGNLRCTGDGGRNFTVSREGQYTMPDGSTGTLDAAQLDQIRNVADGLFRADANNAVACENSGQVSDDESIQANDGAGQMRVIYTADRQDRRRCFLGDRAEIQRLRQALQPLADRYRVMGQPTNPTNPANPANPNAPTNPANPNGTNGGNGNNNGNTNPNGTGGA